jgi:NADPH:quinone reductase-like Zn-dependent oxidoreductase
MHKVEGYKGLYFPRLPEQENTMNAIVYRAYGPPEVLRYEEIEKPTPTANEALIKIHAAALNPLDWHMMRGAPVFLRLFAGLRAPKNKQLGVDVAGTVEDVGREVTQFKPGDAVFGTCNGAYAEYACTAESAVVKKPENVSFEEAASIAIAAFTAVQALRDKGKVRAGQKVLINGAAGGVGTFAVQIAKWMGAEVTGVCSTGNVELVQRLGAHFVVDYTREDFSAGAQHYDVIFDVVGNRTLSEFRRALTPRGTYIGCGGGGPDRPASDMIGHMIGQMVLSLFVRQKLLGILAKRSQDDLNLMAELLATGKIKPVIDRCYRLSEVPDAIRYLEKGHARGKVVIKLQ